MSEKRDEVMTMRVSARISQEIKEKARQQNMSPSSWILEQSLKGLADDNQTDLDAQPEPRKRLLPSSD